MTSVQELIAKRSVTCAAVVIAVFAIFLQMNTTLNHDAAWHFQTSFMWLDGGVIGKDIVDFNPPMTLWYSAPAALFVKLTGVSPRLVFKTYVLLTILLSFGLCRYILKSKIDDLGVRIFALGFAAILMLYPNYHFGQREHLSVVLFLPYLILSIYDRSEWPIWVMVSAGLMAAIGIGFKPHFVLVPIFLESALILYNRSLKQVFRVEALALAGGLLIYLIAIFAIAPSYLGEVLPSAFWSYGYFESRMIELSYFKFGSLFLGLAVVFFWGTREPRRALLVISAVSIAYAIIAFLQNKGWEYHWLPFITMSFIGLLAVAIRPKLFGIRSYIALTIILIFAVIGPRQSLYPQVLSGSNQSVDNTKTRVARLTDNFTKHAAIGDYVYAFITSPRDIHPAVLEAGVKWTDPAGVLLFTPAILSANRDELELAHLAEVENQDRKVLQNLYYKKPKVIVFQLQSRLAVKDTAENYIEHFSNYPGFSKFLDDYHPVDMIDPFQVWVQK